jgi:hypothetical protein
MTIGSWRGAAALLGLTFVIVLATVARMAAQPADPAKLKEGCKVISPDTVVSTITPGDLTNSLPCEETFGAAPPPNAPLDAAQKRLQKGFDFLSWLTFFALNAPADGRDITALSSDPTKDAPAKWEHLVNFRQLADVMRPGPLTLDDWGKRVVPEACKAKFKDGMMVLHLIEEAFNQPFKSGPLIDQNGRYALFDILMNETMFKYIVDNGLGTKAGQAGKPADFVVDFPVGANAARPGAPPKPGIDPAGQIGALMLKVSWKVLDPVKDADLAGKIHTVTALLYTPASNDPKRPATCSDPKKLGLIGFHAGHKTQNRRQWIWTTFEHVQNVPEQADVKAFVADPQKKLPQPRYFFFDVGNPTLPDNRTPPRPWDPSEEPFRDGFKSQITRVIPVTVDTHKMNQEFQSRVKGTVWENYMLVSVQWPSDFACSSNPKQNDPIKQPDMTCAPVPFYLANATLETFSQGSTPLASSSCMSCHNNATSYQRPAAQSDFTFILEKAP